MAILGAVTSSPQTHAADCEPARPAADSASLPDAWRRELEALVAATRREGQPWACGGGEVRLVMDPAGGATLSIRTAAGETIERHLASARDVVPTGEAALATTSRAEAAATEGATTPSDRAPPAAAATPSPTGRAATPPAPERPEPAPRREGTGAQRARLLVDAAASASYTGPERALLAGVALRGTVPIGAWGLGIWVRYEGQAGEFDPTPPGFALDEGNVGVSLRRQVVAAPLDLWIGFDPSVAVVSMDVDEPGGSHLEGARADLRIGADVSAAFPARSVVRAVLNATGEMAPDALRSPASRRIAPTLPELPAFEVGFALGVELAVP